MFANIRDRFITEKVVKEPPLMPYARPQFLQLLTQDEVRASADHNVRPIIVPRDTSLLPWGTGYAECINSGKSVWNEDQCAFHREVLSDPRHKHPDLPYTYFGMFDGHAGYGAALNASKRFQKILKAKLVDSMEMLLRREEEEEHVSQQSLDMFFHPSQLKRLVNKDELIVGALEGAFMEMDQLIESSEEGGVHGGCTACVSLFINGKMYVANAGDSRAVLCQRKTNDTAAATTTAGGQKSIVTGEKQSAADIVPEEENLGSYAAAFSFDHTPESERERILNVAMLQSYLIRERHVAAEYEQRPHRKNLGQRMLCRQGTMKGWTYKKINENDLLMPVLMGEGKRSRLLGTLGVTRGFGDHHLRAATGVLIKPFLTAHPDVKYRDLTKIVSIPDESNEDGDYGILIMGTDGLWDVSENETVARNVFRTLTRYPTEKHRYTMVAQELVARARGKISQSGRWRLDDGKFVFDDISVLVIPVYQYYREHVEWEKRCARIQQEAQLKQQQPASAGEVLVNGSMSNAAVANDDDDEEIVVEVSRQLAAVHAQVEVEEEGVAAVERVEPAASAGATAPAASTVTPNQSTSVDSEVKTSVAAPEATVIAKTTEKDSTPPQGKKDSKKQKQKR